MDAQGLVKDVVKPRVFPDEERLRTVRFGPARGVRVHLNRRHDIQRELGLYETELTRSYRRLIAADAAVYDIGASDGYTTLIYARLASRGHVYAFEPEAYALEKLERNLVANPGLAARVTVVPQAVGEAGSATSIDAFAARDRPPGFVKIDVYGNEVEVLEGMRETLLAHAPAIVVEIHSADLERLCARFLGDVGYRVRVRRNAWWRAVYPEMRPLDVNHWLVAERAAGA
jgi:precorrin-6B methylase 2